MCCIRPPEGVARVHLQLCFYGGKVARGQNTVAVEDKHILALGVFDSIVAGRARSTILLGQILHIEAVGVFVHHLFAGNGRTIFHHHHLEVLYGLVGEALQQFVHFVGTVIYGDDNRVFHWFQVSI